MNKGGIGEALRRLRNLAAGSTTARADEELLGHFAASHDEASFTALLERHGPMVLGVCRRILGNTQDAEDACQAAFLVLARKAGSVRKRGSLASWLFGVAARTSRKLQASRSRRRQAERGAARVEDHLSADELSWREVRAVLDEELLRLPDRYRAPLILCYLEGLTRDQAARRLGLNLNRLRNLLDYGRGLLRRRLSQRGLTLSAILLAGLAVRKASAAVPALVVVSTVKAAVLIAAGRALPPGAVSGRVVALAEGMVRTMFLAKLKVAAVVFLALAGLGIGITTVMPTMLAQPAPAQTETKASPALPPKESDHPLNKSLEGLKKHYALNDGDVLKSARPPHPEERKAFFRTVQELSNQLDTPPWDGNLTLKWKDDGLLFGSVSFSNPPLGHTLESLAQTLAGLRAEEVEGDRTLRWHTAIAGDFVVRDGAPAEKVVGRLEEVLNKELNLAVTLTLAEVERKVYVLSGRYKFTPAGPDQDKDHLEIYAKEPGISLLPPRTAGVPDGRDRITFDVFVWHVRRFVDRRVVLGQVEGLPEHFTWNQSGEDLHSLADADRDHAVELVLRHVAEQTGLSVREETRKVRALIVERKK